MFVRCALVLILTVSLVQTLKCYYCGEVWPAPASDNQLSSGVCNDGFLGNLVNCHGVCFKGRGDIFFRFVLTSQDSTKP